MKPIGICRLCGEQSELVDSHVFPRALALELGSPGDRVRVHAADSGFRSRLIPTGWYGQFLCAACEDKSGPFDDYAVKFLRRSRSSGRPTTVTGHAAIEWPEADPRRLKLFVLWCLWRGAMCGQPEFPANMLGPHAATVAALIRSDDVGTVEDYGVVLEAIDCDPTMVWVSWCRYRNKLTGVNLYRCLVHGFVLHVKVDRRPLPPKHATVALDPARPLVTPVSAFVGSPLGNRVFETLFPKGSLE